VLLLLLLLQAVVELLLSAGANPNLTDNLGGCALREAVKENHTDIAELLVAAGANLCMSGDKLAGRLCSLAAADDVDTLRRYIAAGADVNVGDYDRRTALHIAAAEGKLEVVALLVEVGGADIGVTDRWGATPGNEAERVGAAAVVEYLKGVAADRAKAGAGKASSSRAGGLWRK
jgi:hyperpolarization activated cyclic nucleotide-gated potassium channel 4